MTKRATSKEPRSKVTTRVKSKTREAKILDELKDHLSFHKDATLAYINRNIGRLGTDCYDEFEELSAQIIHDRGALSTYEALLELVQHLEEKY